MFAPALALAKSLHETCRDVPVPSVLRTTNKTSQVCTQFTAAIQKQLAAAVVSISNAFWWTYGPNSMFGCHRLISGAPPGQSQGFRKSLPHPRSKWGPLSALVAFCVWQPTGQALTGGMGN